MDDLLVFVTEPGGRMLWTKPALERCTGSGLADFQYDNPDNPFIHPDDLPMVGGLLADFAASDEVVSKPLVNRFITKWGETVLFASVVHKVSWEGQTAFRVEARQVAASTAADARFPALVDAMPDGVVQTDARGRMYYTNRVLQGWVGRDPVALKQLTVFDLVAQSDRGLLEQQIARVAAGGEVASFEARLADGGERVVEVRAALGPTFKATRRCSCCCAT